MARIKEWVRLAQLLSKADETEIEAWWAMIQAYNAGASDREAWEAANAVAIAAGRRPVPYKE